MSWMIGLFVVLLLYQIMASVMDLRDMKRYRGMEITEKERIHFYKEAIVYGWIPVGIIILFVLFSPLSFFELGLRKITMSDSLLLNGAVFVIGAMLASALLYQALKCATDKKYRQRMLEEVKHGQEKGNYYEQVTTNLVLPRSWKEKRYFFFVSLTAGICEEFVWRGCMIFLLTNIFSSLHIGVISIMVSLLFGLFHCYQGVYGVAKTGVLALLFVAVYLATDSLIVGMILHFWFDFSSAFLIMEET